MGWLWALGILTVLGLLPIGIGFSYRNGEPRLQLRVALIPIRIDLNRLTRKKEEPEKKKEAQKPEDSPVNPAAPKPKAPRRKLRDLKPLLYLAVDFLGDLRRRLQIDRLDLNLVLAGDDPCDLAILYGSTCAAAGNVTALLERLFVINKRNIQIQCDFIAEKTQASGRVDLHLTLGRILALGLGYGYRALKLLLNMKKRKGGALL